MKWLKEKAIDGAEYRIKVKNTIYEKHSKYQKIEIVDTELFGKVLSLDNIFQTSTKDEFFYHEMLVHPIMTLNGLEKNVLIIGGGDGGSLKRVLQHENVKSVYLVEIDEDVIKTCKKYIPEIAEDAWSDSRVNVIIGDGTQFIKNPPVLFDIIIIDGSDPVGPAKVLIKQEFYNDCRNALTSYGKLVTQSESPYIMPNEFTQIYQNLKKVFPHVYTYLAPVPLYTSGFWSYTIGSKYNCHYFPYTHHYKVPKISTEKIEKHCNYYNKNIHEASFILPTFIKKQLNLSKNQK